MRYQIDPSTPYTEFSKNEAAIDYLQFPNQSLDYKAGDCDDLSILYGALLESLGIQTAFVTVPGHIYLAFALAMPASEAAGRFRRANDLIFLKDRAWLPMEVTMIQGGFLRAWEEGAREWRENSARKQADLYPVHEAWELYEPVGFAGTPLTITLPDEKALLAAYAREVGRFVDAELVPQEAELQKQIQSQGPDPKLINKLGVLYARYGLNDKAEVQFQKALSVRKDFPQALVNIGNLAFLSGDMRKAISYYERAQKGLPDNPGVALGLAKASYELKDYDAAARYYAATKRLDAALAERFAYLDLKTGDSQMRASAAEEMREAVIWGE
jgi:tetratricopeptide (TPR) repeat protein